MKFDSKQRILKYSIILNNPVPGYCDVCNRSSSWFWSKYDNWWNPKLYCSYKCNAIGSAPEHLIFGLLLLVIGIFTFLKGGVILILFGLISILTGFYGIKQPMHSRVQNRKNESSYSYNQIENNFDETQDKAHRDMYG